MNKFLKRYQKSILVVLAACLLTAFILLNDPSRHMTLTIGIYAGSSWDVPNSNANVIDEVIEKFEKEYPNITVKYESGISKNDYSSWLAEKIVNGEQPDAFIVPSDEFSLLANTKALYDLSSFVKTDNVDLYSFYDSTIASARNNEHLLGLPLESNPTMMCVNKDLLKKEGITLPSKLTPKNFYDICKKVTHGNQYGVCEYSWQDVLSSNGLSVFNEDGTKANINTRSFKNAINYLSQLESLNNGYQVTSKDFDEGRVAFMPMTLAQYRTYMPYPYRVAKFSTFTWDCVSMPSSIETPTQRMKTTIFSLSSKSPYKQVAWNFIKMLCMDEDVQQMLFTKNLGASPLKSVMNSASTKKTFNSEHENNSLTTSTIDKIMEHSIAYHHFKKESEVEDRLDYLLGKEMKSSNEDIDFEYLQNEIDKSL